jgi:recombination protein RecT
MSNITTTKQSLVKKATKETFSTYLTKDAVKNQINTILGGKDGTRFMTSILSAVSTNPALAECTHPSIISGALLGESLKLSPSPQLGQYYLIPFKNTKENTTTATFVLGFKGYIQLAIRSGFYKTLNVLAIKDGELKSYNPLTEELEIDLIQDDEEREKAKTIGYYAMFEYNNGFRKSIYWSKKKMLSHADKYSKAFSVKEIKSDNPAKSRVSFEDFENGNYPKEDAWKYSSFWYQNFDEMALKTMLRQLISKWGIMSIDLQKAYESDNAVINEDMKPTFVDSDSGEEIIISNEVPQNNKVEQVDDVFGDIQ